MSQFVPIPSDQLPIPPVSTAQSSNDQPSLIRTADDASKSAGEPPLEVHTTTNNNPRSDTFPYRPIDVANNLLAQSQRNFALMEKPLSLAIQSMANTSSLAAAMVPHISPISANIFRLTEFAPEPLLAPLHDISRAFVPAMLSTNLHIERQLQPLFHSIHDAMIDDFHAKVARSSSAVASVLVETVRSCFTVDIEHVTQSFRSVLPRWEDFPPPALLFPELSAVNQILSMTSFLPDISWVTDLTDHINTILMALPDWASLNIKGWKERIKQRLMAAFRLARLCFAPSMSEDLMYQIADLIEASGKRSSITLLVWNYYARNNHARLQQAVDRWQDNPEYARRWRQIVLPAFQAHTRGDYGLSISALVPLVEGISGHIVKKNMLLPTKKPKKGLLGLGSTESVILRTLKIAGDEDNLESDTTDLTHWVRVKSVLGYIEDVFCKPLEFEVDYDLIHLGNRQLHRHGLSHGIQINAMTALNSLRLFLLLDTMHSLLQTYIARGGIM